MLMTVRYVLVLFSRTLLLARCLSFVCYVLSLMLSLPLSLSLSLPLSILPHYHYFLQPILVSRDSGEGWLDPVCGCITFEAIFDISHFAVCYRL